MSEELMAPIIFWGAKGHAKVLYEAVSRLGYRLVALFDNDPNVAVPIPGIPVYIGTQGFIDWCSSQSRDMPIFGLVAIGGARGSDRLRIQRFLVQHGIQPAVLIHPTAYVAGDVSLGAGSQVLAHATVCAGARIGESVIINTAASVDHECVLGQGVHIAPGATLTGCITVGDYTLIGAGSVILPNLNIGSNVIIGAGSVVTRDIPEGKVAYGNPAKVIRDK